MSYSAARPDRICSTSVFLFYWFPSMASSWRRPLARDVYLMMFSSPYFFSLLRSCMSCSSRALSRASKMSLSAFHASFAVLTAVPVGDKSD